METWINFVIRRTFVVFHDEWIELILDPAAILCSQDPPDVVLSSLCQMNTLLKPHMLVSMKQALKYLPI